MADNNNYKVKKIVLHVGPLMPPVGGVAVALDRIVHCSELTDFNHVVFNTSDGQPIEFVGRKRIGWKRALRKLKRAYKLLSHVRQVRPDIIHFQFGSESMADQIGDFIVMLACRLPRTKVILHMHVDPLTSDLPGTTYLNNLLFRYLSLSAQVIFTLTEQYEKHLLSCSLKQKIYVVPNMCDDDYLRIPIERPENKNQFLVLYMGRLTHAKGIYDLIAVASALYSDYPEICFAVAGLPTDQDEEKKIKSILDEYDLHNNLKLLGNVTGQEKFALFAAADVVFITSYHESFGIVAIESMASGLPVLGTDVSGLSSIIIENQTGFLVKPGDISTMKDRILQLYQNKDLRAMMGHRGRQRFVKYYSSKKVGAIIKAAYVDNRVT